MTVISRTPQTPVQFAGAGRVLAGAIGGVVLATGFVQPSVNLNTSGSTTLKPLTVSVSVDDTNIPGKFQLAASADNAAYGGGGALLGGILGAIFSRRKKAPPADPPQQ
jgi:hypothetical protein